MPARTSKDWSPEVVDLLERIRVNSTNLSEYHRRRFYHFKSFSKYFDMPILVLSIFGSSFAVGVQRYVNQHTISGVSCLIGVIVSIITSIKLYLSVETSMQSELKMSKAFYSLSIDIFRALTLDPKDRGEKGLGYLQKVFGNYSKLMEESHLLAKRFSGDKLTPDTSGAEPPSPPPSSSDSSMDFSLSPLSGKKTKRKQPTFTDMRALSFKMNSISRRQKQAEKKVENDDDGSDTDEVLLEEMPEAGQDNSTPEIQVSSGEE